MCIGPLNELIHSGRFKQLEQEVSEAICDLFRSAVAATINTIHGPGELSNVQVAQLYGLILPAGTSLPFCVEVNETPYSWFVPIDTENTKYKSCLWFDKELQSRVLAAQAVYSDSWVPFVTPSVVTPPVDVRAKIDMIVWFIWFIMKKSGRGVVSWDDETSHFHT
jgi:hypothetical protein